jgi:hypothetical protein
MRPTQFGILFAASVLAATTSLGAQQPTHANSTVRAAVSLAGAAGVERIDGHPFAFGNGFKATFAAGGMQYTPALGREAPHNMPLRFTLQSVRRGNQSLLEAQATAAPDAQITGNRVSYHRGAIGEHYDVRPAGIEQSFSFATPLGGDGDLVVRGRIDTELEGCANADGSLSWLLAGVGGVHYGTVTGIDADGRRVRGALRRDGNALELVLPDAFVDGASYPLVLDPLLSTEFLVPGAANSDPDVAYDASNDVYLAVFQHVFSALDIDVYAQRLDGSTGAVIGGTIVVDASVSAVGHARVASVNSTNQFLVVWQQAPGPWGPWDVKCRRVDAAAGTMSAVVNVAATTENELDPCVSGEASSSADNEALVIWRDSTGIIGSQVTVAAAVDPVVVGPVALGGGLFSQAPSISKSGGTVGRHVVAWHETGLIGDSEIWATCVDRNLGILAPAAAITANTVNDTMPSVDGNGTSFMLAWQRAEAGSRSDIRMMRVNYSGGALVTIVADTPLENDAGQDEATPDVCYLGQKFAIVYREEVVGFTLLDDIYVWVVDTSCERCGVRSQLDGLNVSGADYENTPRCVGHYAGSGSTASDAGITVFTESLDVPPFSGVVIAQRFEAVGPGGPIVNLGGACGVLGVHDTTGGGFAVGNTGFTFRASGIPPIALTFISLAVPAPLVPCGPCVLVSPLVLTFVPNPGTGTVTHVFPVPCDPIFVGFQLDTQWVAIGTVASPCPALTGLGVSATNILRSTLAF